MNTLKQFIFNKHEAINFGLLVLCCASIFYLIVGVNSFGYEPLAKLPLPVIILLITIMILSFDALLIFNIIKKEYKPNVSFIILLSIIFVANIFALLIFSNKEFQVHETTFTSAITTESKIIYSFQFLGILLLFFLIFDFIPSIFKNYKLIYIVCFVAIVVAYFTIIYSLISDFDFYKTFIPKIFNKENLNNYPDAYYPNKNSYSVILLMGLVGSLFINNKYPKFYWYIVSGLLTFFILISFCKGVIFATILLMFSYLIYRFIITFKEHKLMNIISLISILSTFVILSVSFIVICSIDKEFYSYFSHLFFDGIPGSFYSRVEIWHNTFALLSQTNLYLGFGFHIYGDLLFQSLGMSSINNAIPSQFAHNVVMELLGNGGIILLAAAIIVFSYFIYINIAYIKRELRLVIFNFILIASFIPLMSVESGSLIFPFTMDYAFFSAVLLVPILNIKKQTDYTSIFY